MPKPRSPSARPEHDDLRRFRLTLTQDEIGKRSLSFFTRAPQPTRVVVRLVRRRFGFSG